MMFETTYIIKAFFSEFMIGFIAGVLTIGIVNHLYFKNLVEEDKNKPHGVINCGDVKPEVIKNEQLSLESSMQGLRHIFTALAGALPRRHPGRIRQKTY